MKLLKVILTSYASTMIGCLKSTRLQSDSTPSLKLTANLWSSLDHERHVTGAGKKKKKKRNKF